jgi:hypothetical protein
MQAWSVVRIGWLSFALFGGCSHADEPAPSGATLLEYCRDDRPCESGLTCNNSQCTKPCTTAADCGSIGGCGVGAQGERLCTPSCNSGLDAAVPEAVCIDGAYQHCASNPCAAGTTCVPKLGCVQVTGGPCKSGFDCASRNCGADGTCKVADGEACTSLNCDFCATLEGVPERTFCVKPCENWVDCTSGVCERFQGSFVCRPPCIPECTCLELVPENPSEPYQQYCSNELLRVP